MSAWRLVTVALHKRGGSGTALDLRRCVHLDGSAISTALTRARRLGVVAKRPRASLGDSGRSPTSGATTWPARLGR